MTATGFASGCFTATGYDEALALTREHGGTAFEIGCYRTEWIPVALDWCRRPVPDIVVSLHLPRFAPAREPTVAAAFGATGLPLVLHADRLRVPAHWRALGARVLVENVASPTGFGSTAPALDEVFTHLPEAAFCLDVSHAFGVGGEDLVAELARRFRSRLAQLHVGCTGVAERPERTPPDADLVALALAHADVEVPVIIERPHPDDPRALLAGITAVVTGAGR